MSTQIKVPKLRFPEFSGEWEEKKIGQVFGIFQGYAFSSNDSVDDGIKWVKIADVGIQKMKFHSPSYLPNTYLEKYKKFILKKGDYVIALTRPILNGSLKIALIDDTYDRSLLNQRVGKLLSDNDHTFVYCMLQCQGLINDIDRSILGSEPPNLSTEQIKHIKTFIPSKPEQQKIASFLTSIDTKIEQLTKKKALLEQYKKSVMQKIFSQEIRFRDDDGSEYPGWVEKKLGEVAEIIMGQSPESNSYNLDEIGQPLIQGNADIQNRLSNPRNWTTQTTKECKVGDLILTVRAPVGAVAKSVHNACIGRGVCAIRNNSTSKIEFLFQFLLDFESKWGNLEQGSTFTAVSGNEIKKLKIHMPTLKEQTKIANFLTSLDAKLRHVETQLNSTKQFKKALLQKMFV